MMQGLETFARYFAGDEARYILIGGVATQLVLGEAGLPARATKDLDVVLCVEALDSAFGSKLWAFVAEGGYAVRQQGEQGRCFYRFAKPANPVFPQMLEFFARAPGHMPLAPGAHLTPVPFEQEVQSLSAILLDADYYAFLHAHTVQLAGLHIVTEQALIALKARACGVSPMLRPCRTVWTGLSSLIVSIFETIKFINRPFKTRENPHTTSHRRTPPCSSGKGSGSGHSLTEWVFFGLSRFQEKDHDPQEFRFCFHRRRAARLRHRLCRRLAACCG